MSFFSDLRFALGVAARDGQLGPRCQHHRQCPSRQFPNGYLADKWSRMGVVVASARLTTLLSVGMIWAISSWTIWPQMLILGTAAFAIYTWD